MKKCWICGRTGKEVDEEYTNNWSEYISGWSGSGGSPDKLINDINPGFGDSPIPVCVICIDAIEIIAENRINERLDDTIDAHIKRVLKGLLLSSLKGG